VKYFNASEDNLLSWIKNEVHQPQAANLSLKAVFSLPGVS
jgi:hypothetical protein